MEFSTESRFTAAGRRRIPSWVPWETGGARRSKDPDSKCVEKPTPSPPGYRRARAPGGRLRAKLMRRIAIINQKGGVGKTTTAVNLGAALARLGRRVLVVDMDPQANASQNLGAELEPGEPSTYSLLTQGGKVTDTLRGTSTPGLSVLPAHLDLSGAELELASAIGRETILKDALDDWENEELERSGRSPADVVLIDNPPSLGLLSVNGLTASSEVLIAVQTEFFALQGLSKLVEIVQLLRRRMKPDLEITGVLACMYDSPPAARPGGARRAALALPRAALQAAHRAEREARGDPELLPDHLRVRPRVQGRGGLPRRARGSSSSEKAWSPRTRPDPSRPHQARGREGRTWIGRPPRPLSRRSLMRPPQRRRLRPCRTRKRRGIPRPPAMPPSRRAGIPAHESTPGAAEGAPSEELAPDDPEPTQALNPEALGDGNAAAPAERAPAPKAIFGRGSDAAERGLERSAWTRERVAEPAGH